MRHTYAMLHARERSQTLESVTRTATLQLVQHTPNKLLWQTALCNTSLVTFSNQCFHLTCYVAVFSTRASKRLALRWFVDA